MSESRKHDRVMKRLRAEVHTQEGMTFSTTVDLSAGGLFISTPEPLGSGTPVTLSLMIGEDGGVDVNGEVRWAREDEQENTPSGMGIEFVGIQDKDMKKIIDLLRE